MSEVAQPLILVVEDDPTIRKLVAMIAGRRHVECIAVASCEQALSEMQEHVFNLVLMDWTLPLQNGLECTQVIRDSEEGTGRHMPIIAMTANLMPGDKEACLACGMDDFIGKPFTMSEFYSLLDRWIGDGLSVLPFAGPNADDQPAAGSS